MAGCTAYGFQLHQWMGRERGGSRFGRGDSRLVVTHQPRYRSPRLKKDMTAFVFWNIHRKDLRHLIVDLVRSHQVDVLMLAESITNPGALLGDLNCRGGSEYYYSPIIGCEKIEIFTRFPSEFIRPISETDRLTIRRLRLPGSSDIILAVVHFPSKQHWTDASQAMECAVLSRTIIEAERQEGHARTILVGDLNINPFETGVVSANGLNGVMSKRVAERINRVVQQQKYPLFYNPMWNLLGDETPGPPGTYYHTNGQHVDFFWHMFDQVLVRPDILSSFKTNELTILETAGSTSLLSGSGYPDQAVGSDHLPLLFQLEL